jgi:peptidoglycan pentaglycine glycine transferase (the first glycine)
MAMSLVTERDRGVWNRFVQRSPDGSFLQSWEWGEAQRAFGVPVWRLAAWDRERLTGVALVVERTMPSGRRWLYIPRGPLWQSPRLEAQSPNIFDHVVTLAKEQRALFVRTEPAREPGRAWRKADHDVQPRHTLVIDLKRLGDQLLGDMHVKTRYNIHLAKRKGVSVRFSRALEDVELFLQLSREVSGRSSFRFHPDDYYRSLLRVLGGDVSPDSPAARAELGVAECEGEALAAHVLVSFGDTVTYVHGASSSRKRHVMAPHLLQWESIKRAREHGFAHYDLYGVAPPSPTGGRTAGQGPRALAGAPHPWAGITRFKEGFGGRSVGYPGAYDLVLDRFGYWLYSAARRLRR